MDSSLCWVRGTVSSTAVAAVDVDGAVLCGARPKREGADAMHAETIPPKGRTRHRKFEPKASRSPSDVSKQSLSTFINIDLQLSIPPMSAIGPSWWSRC